MSRIKICCEMIFLSRIEEAIAEGNDTLETTGGNIEDELLAEVEEPEPVLAEQTEEPVNFHFFQTLEFIAKF